MNNDILIDITSSSFNYYNNRLFRDTVEKFLKENPNIKIDTLVDGDVTTVFTEVLANNLNNVKDRLGLYHLLEKIYDYWRNHIRYMYADLSKASIINESNFLKIFDDFNEIVISLYRTICSNLTGKKFSVLRELPAGANAFMLLDKTNTNPYKELNDIPFLTKIAFKTPFVSYSKSNKRDGIFEEINENPISGFNKEDFFCFPILVGNSHIFVYFKKEYLSLALSLANLFAHDDDFKTTKPDGIVLFGSNTKEGIYFDNKKDLYVASLIARDEIDYFGYLKKIILTVHNLKMIKENKLPIHGAGVTITLKDYTKKTIVLVGDSGAGKSETLEALREIANDDILDIETIYDDMGTLEIIGDEIYTYGTEIGAFVRIDDLAHDYIYKVFDRAIFLNPNKKNARLVLPVSDYSSVISPRHVDYFLYANNYLENDNKINLYDNYEEALNIFRKGNRVALGTTTEQGLVSTYFANPFGPVQEWEKCDLLLDKYFKQLYNNKIKVGELYTGLALTNGKENPKEAAEILLKLLKAGV